MKPSVQEIYETYSRSIYDASFSITGSSHDAEDILQETLISYLQYKKDFSSTEHLKAWLLRVAINKSRDLKRRFWNRNRVSFEDYLNDVFQTESEDKELLTALMKFPEKQRIVLHLHYYEGYSVSEISSLLKIPEGTVKSRMTNGRNALKELLKEENSDE